MYSKESITANRSRHHLSLRLMSLMIVLPFLSTVVGCEREFSPEIPVFNGSESILRGTRSLKPAESSVVEGVYKVTDGSDQFGQEVAVLFVRDGISIFCKPEGAYFLLDAGVKQDEVFLEGYWRKALNLKAGGVQLSIAEAEGGRVVTTGTDPAEGVTIRGFYSTDNDEALDRPLTLSWDRGLPDSAERFFVIGHRGGGRNSDFLPHSENSLDMLRFAPRLGCNAVEIDILLTSDKVPILYHDLEFSTRLVESDHMVGPVSNYTFDQIRRFARLIDGGLIPTFEEALATIEKIPEIDFIWVDVKTPETMGVVAPIIQEWNRKRRGDSNRAEVVAGLPLPPILDAYKALSSEQKPEALCELGPGPTREINARVWAPRWTLGLQQNELTAMKGEGRYAFVWTLDLPEFIGEYMGAGYDGILSNYPSLVAYYYYTGGSK